jgi:hypothetical protein
VTSWRIAPCAGASLAAIGDAWSLSVDVGGRVVAVFIGLFDRRVQATSNGRIRPEGRQSLDRLPATARPAFFPCRQGAAFLAGQKSRLPPSSAVLRA